MSALGLSFEFRDVRQWAEFSSDFNPIHFDRESAKMAGLADLVVHGMLVLLPIKRALARRAREEGQVGPGWMRFNALFRQPVAHAEPTLLTMAPGRRGGLEFRLVGTEQPTERFRGSLISVDDPAGGVAQNAAEERSVRALQGDHAARFAQSYPDIDEGWLALDAIVFSDFMRMRLGEVERGAQAHLATLTKGRGASGLLFVQASHTVFFDTDALAAPGPLPMPLEQLDCSMSAPEVMANPDKLIGSVALSVRHAGRLVMRMEIGLLARPNISHP
jgi:hypothetical protein